MLAYINQQDSVLRKFQERSIQLKSVLNFTCWWEKNQVFQNGEACLNLIKVYKVRKTVLKFDKGSVFEIDEIWECVPKVEKMC